MLPAGCVGKHMIPTSIEGSTIALSLYNIFFLCMNIEQLLN